MSSKLKFNDSARFMASSLSYLVNNFEEGVHKIKCKYGHDDKKIRNGGITCKHYECCVQYTDFKDDLIVYKCVCCNKIYQKRFDQNFKKRFANTYKLLTMILINLF